MVVILMMSVKLDTLGLFKIKIFQNKSYGVKIFVYDVTSKILLRDSNYVVDVIMWQKSNISIRGVVITSIL